MKLQYVKLGEERWCVIMSNINSRICILVVQGSAMGTGLPVVSTWKMPETFLKDNLDFI